MAALFAALLIASLVAGCGGGSSSPDVGNSTAAKPALPSHQLKPAVKAAAEKLSRSKAPPTVAVRATERAAEQKVAAAEAKARRHQHEAEATVGQ